MKLVIKLSDKKKEIVVELPGERGWHEIAVVELAVDGKVVETKRLYAGTHLHHGRLQLSAS